jgi:lipopolysaccharide biosynthesis glycosyltransferase
MTTDVNTDIDCLSNNKISSAPDKNNEPIVIVCAADDKYSMPLSVMARSVLANLKNKRKVQFFIIDGGIRDKNKRKIRKTLNFANCDVSFIPKPDTLSKKLEAAYQYTITDGLARKYLAIASYYRLMIADLLPEQLDKAIYLDCDLVIEGDLEELWETNLEENFLLAAKDLWIPSVSSQNGLLNYKELEIPADNAYFNAGVLVVNLKKWRTEGFFTKAVNYLNKNKDTIRFADQDILNGLLAQQWGELHPRWNVTPGVFEYSKWQDSPFSETIYQEMVSQPYITHFAAEAKPWNSLKSTYKEQFYRYVDITEWKGWRFTRLKAVQIKIAQKFKKLKARFNK